MLSAAATTSKFLARKSIQTRKFATLESLNKTSPFINSVIKPDQDLDIPDKVSEALSKTPRQLKSGFYSYTYPTERKKYQFLSASPNALKDLDLDPVNEPKSEYFQDIMAGKTYYQSEDPKVFPFAMAYAGFQFGNFAGQLGDGRVVNLFTVPSADGKQTFDLQLKGAGKTPFSRFADGNAVLRSSIREYVISEYLHAVGIPSTRALAITAYPENKAQRVGAEICAVVCRMSPSWIRVGHFDYCRMKGDRQGLFDLCEYIDTTVFKGEYTTDLQNYMENDADLKAFGELTTFDKLFLDIIIRNSKSVAYWHTYGFLNGVLNTDNTSILGLAIDFGPFAIMDKFDPNYTSNSEDHELRYSFKNTPSAIWFNMVKLAESMAEVLGAGPNLINDPAFRANGYPDDAAVDSAMTRVNKLIRIGGDIFEKTFIDDYLRLVSARLGITTKASDNQDIFPLLFETLQVTKLEYNNFFLKLQQTNLMDDNFDILEIAKSFIPSTLRDVEEVAKINKELVTFLTIFKARCEEELLTDDVRRERASKANPQFVPKNWILQDVIDFTTEKLEKGEEASAYLDKIMKMANNPYDKSQWGQELKEVEDKWLSTVDDSKLMTTCSCSS